MANKIIGNYGTLLQETGLLGRNKAGVRITNEKYKIEFDDAPTIDDAYDETNKTCLLRNFNIKHPCGSAFWIGKTDIANLDVCNTGMCCMFHLPGVASDIILNTTL